MYISNLYTSNYAYTSHTSYIYIYTSISIIYMRIMHLTVSVIPTSLLPLSPRLVAKLQGAGERFGEGGASHSVVEAFTKQGTGQGTEQRSGSVAVLGWFRQ